jgi:hypothetical protein
VVHENSGSKTGKACGKLVFRSIVPDPNAMFSFLWQSNAKLVGKRIIVPSSSNQDFQFWENSIPNQLLERKKKEAKKRRGTICPLLCKCRLGACRCSRKEEKKTKQKKQEDQKSKTEMLLYW